MFQALSAALPACLASIALLDIALSPGKGQLREHEDMCLMGAVLCVLAITACVRSADRREELKGMNSIYDFTMKDIDGNDRSLAVYTGKVVMIVNVASKCGFTGQYAGLEKLYLKYKDRGFVILGFPANNFLGQEPGSNEEIRQFCSLTYNVTFPMFSKISVKGDDLAPLYRFLTDKTTDPEHGGSITWNFNKFLIGRDGKIINRFGTRTPPEDKDLISAIESAL
jgi:glutathione peroxidase-family protein